MISQNDPILRNWYKIVKSSSKIFQGDLLNNVPVIKTLGQISENETGIQSKQVRGQGLIINCVVMTQSCDIENTIDKDIPIFLCPRQDFSDTLFPNSKNHQMEQANSNHWKLLTLGKYTNYCLLDECRFSTIQMKHQVVNLSQIYTMPLSYLEEFVRERGFRLRLISPFLESVSQQFARQFMRVGLPSKFPSSVPTLPAQQSS